ncbi:hypothetical protein NDU88_003151 [Pleurodeles waltl]|uniref:Secreted protein n=1 Tax=Pleurodeles waltl TaxID=8319 RepID=A0AAV7LEK4_PLEWA|nr:hypothetical protein NDU88_003151 [Pleurodeles waltl]
MTGPKRLLFFTWTLRVPKSSTHSLFRGREKHRTPTQRLRDDWNFNARPRKDNATRLPRRNRRDAWRESETLTHSPTERRAARKQAGESTHRPGTSGNPRDLQKETVRVPENDARLTRVKNNDASPCVLGRNRRTHHFSTYLFFCGPLQRFSTQNQVLCA